MTLTSDLKRMGFTPEQIASATIGGRPLAEVDKPKSKRSDGWPGFRSKWEALYAMELDAVKASGEIVEWAYEAVTFRLTEATIVNGKKTLAIRYTPDFVCWLPDGRMRCIEVKGFRRTKDINRFKLAKDKFRHIEFLMVSRNGGRFEVIL
jgi:hypothetical protein